MSYQVLARKWRPSNFTEVAGQAHVLKSLINALDNQRLHHAYLFTGTRGVGKTTLARILAKCLNCEEGVSSKPCEKCDSCREISEGRFIDLMEIDAASRTKVEDTREMLDNVQYTPARGRYKVYLIDEVHMLSNHSFNALLKTLEEPPPHVKFLFATTDPQKLPITILSRCLQFNLKNLSPKMISDYLASVLKQEAIDFDEEALWQVAAAAGGSMRDALTLVDQAISFCEGSVSASGVVEMLGVPEQQQIFQLLSNMASGNVESVLQLINVVAEQTPDYSHTLDSLLSLLHRVAIAQVMPDAIDNSFGDRDKVLHLAGEISAEDVQLYYQIGSKGREELRYSGEIRATFEMLLLRMMVFSPTFVAESQKESGDNSVKSISAAGESDSAELEKKKIVPAESDSQVSSPFEEPCIEASSDLVSIPVKSDDENIAVIEPELAELENNNDKDLNLNVSMAQQPEIEPEPEPPIDEGLRNSSEEKQASLEKELARDAELDKNSVEKISLDSLDHEVWLRNFSSVPANGIVANVLANTQLLTVQGNTLELRLDINQSAVFGDELLARMEDVLSDWLSEKIAVTVVIAEVDKETPALLSQRLRAEKHADMVMDFEQDTTVQDLLTRFSGSILQDSISSIQAKDNGKGER